MNDLANIDSCRLFQAQTEIHLFCTVKKKGYNHCYNLFLDMGASHSNMCKLHI